MKKPIGANAAWTIPQPTADFVAKHAAEQVDRWRKLVGRVVNVANENNWTKAEVARRAGIPDSTFSQWINGNYVGALASISDPVGNWLEALEESSNIAASLPVSPGFLKTPVGMDVYETLLFAQISSGLVKIILPSGSGKTTAARHFCAIRPYAFMVTASPHTKTTHGVLVDVAAELDVIEHNPTRLVRAIGRKLQRMGEGTLLVVDEAQNLVPDAVNQLRHFVDIYKCGLALLGNEHTAVSFFRDSDAKTTVNARAQVATRFDRNLKREREPAKGAAMLISAWGVEDEDCVRFLTVIASKPGALRNIDRTVKAAAIAALGAGQDLGIVHLRDAWRNRDQGDVA